MTTLYYVHDPMCSWCWAFRPVLHEALSKLPESIEVNYLVGGLAPDSDETMDDDTQTMIQHHWNNIIERVPGTQFNFDFWTLNIPRRSTYSACRAVLAAKNQNPNFEDAMIHAIQQVYYLQAQNPSDENTLMTCAESVGLNTEQFQGDLHSIQTNQQFIEQVKLARSMPIRGFPSLVLEEQGRFISVPIDYLNAESILNFIAAATEDKNF